MHSAEGESWYHLSTDISKVFLVQKKCIRAVCGVAPLDSCRPLFKKLNVLTLTGLYIMQIGIFVKEHPEKFEQFDICAYTETQSRDPSRLRAIYCKTALMGRNCNVMAIKVFNKIPRTFRELPLKYFKVRLHKWLVEKCFYNVTEFFNCQN